MNDADVVMLPAREFHEMQERVSTLEVVIAFWRDRYAMVLPEEIAGPPTHGQLLSAGLVGFRERKRRRTA